MIYAGLCSLTLGHLPPAEVIALCKETELTHIEWWGRDNGHVPMGDVDVATTVGAMTREAGLIIPTYGSYYRVGESEAQGLTFDSVLRTAVALGAPAVRVWAGTQGTDVITRAQREAVIDDAMRIADLCAAADLTVVFEYHQGTLTDSNASAVALAETLQHPTIQFGWQARTGVPVSENMEGLQGILPRLGTLHVFNWSADDNCQYIRHSLDQAIDEWRGYFNMVAETGRDHAALLEFVQDNSVEQFKKDAGTLRTLLCQ
jgi:3-dehydroshikimate dehydratase